MAETSYEAILVVGFGGPERRDDVMPFLENVVRGRNVPRERLLEVAEHYYHFDGVSPINRQVRELIDALRLELDRHDIGLPIYWGNRNWHPLLPDTLREMTGAGVNRALGLVLAGYSSYSSCRQYQENVIDARETVGADAPAVDKIRVFYNHPDFIVASAERLREAVAQLPELHRESFQVAFTAHSIPGAMAEECDYERQLRETCRLIAEELQLDASRWELVYQSRSGPPQMPWLEPDILDHIRALHEQGTQALVIDPVGFLSDHLEVLYDLDEEARHLCDELELPMSRAGTVGTHPLFVGMLRELIQERLGLIDSRRAIGQYPASHDACPANCCPAPVRPRRPGT